ncbi:hypothetical protein GRJ2_000192900 [Grus japonensis]|uniref:Uncharacterized protein n=1 Tax=Grus japonensis TaxID=30415 RepID=A0ABC9VZR3_GRUJA
MQLDKKPMPGMLSMGWAFTGRKSFTEVRGSVPFAVRDGLSITQPPHVRAGLEHQWPSPQEEQGEADEGKGYRERPLQRAFVNGQYCSPFLYRNGQGCQLACNLFS